MYNSLIWVGVFLRVVSGLARGHKLVDLGESTVRPTSDRAREAIFSTISGKLQGAYFLDMFAGSGAMGIEALSRGASFAAFIESEVGHTDIIRKNLALVSKALKEPEFKVINEAVPHALRHFEGKGFDIIFMDPPYKSGLWRSALSIVHEMSLLNEGGIVIVEISKDEGEPELDLPFSIVKRRNYGAAVIYYIEI